MFKKNIIKDLQTIICPELYIELKKLNAMIAGGAITSLYTGKPINDLDIYFKNKEDAEKAIHLFKNKDYDLIAKTNNAITFKQKKDILVDYISNTTYQLIIGDELFYNNPKDLIDNFDFTINMAVFDLQSGELIIGKDFEEHNLKRQLVYNHNTKYPIISLQRAIKYINRGYNLSGIEQIKIALHINSLLIKDSSNLKTHLQGIDTSFFQPIIDDLMITNNEKYDYDIFKEKLK